LKEATHTSFKFDRFIMKSSVNRGRREEKMNRRERRVIKKGENKVRNRGREKGFKKKSNLIKMTKFFVVRNIANITMGRKAEEIAIRGSEDIVIGNNKMFHKVERIK
jgi:hypothetical protein